MAFERKVPEGLWDNLSDSVISGERSVKDIADEYGITVSAVQKRIRQRREALGMPLAGPGHNLNSPAATSKALAKLKSENTEQKSTIEDLQRQLTTERRRSESAEASIADLQTTLEHFRGTLRAVM
ncbi:hypothetical protein C7C46_05715 [Streptomyces tateyamensis]|uniref:Uncharacterized protein n=1 Tax=Streptomyces tateyamensis TaxID=565073 RepID=A0A2V4NYL1_9ACTN|nr:hypothetical protein [Streptomyces tateyamensis]PYC86606.1 hypothetical protein C7C46_05715 [Streptomyces tateyamensis]